MDSAQLCSMLRLYASFRTFIERLFKPLMLKGFDHTYCNLTRNKFQSVIFYPTADYYNSNAAETFRLYTSAPSPYKEIFSRILPKGSRILYVVDLMGVSPVIPGAGSRVVPQA